MDDNPLIDENFPVGQLSHAVDDVAPMLVENVPALQEVHEEDPILSEYFPAGHTWHESGPLSLNADVINEPSGQVEHPQLTYEQTLDDVQKIPLQHDELLSLNELGVYVAQQFDGSEQEPSQKIGAQTRGFG